MINVADIPLFDGSELETGAARTGIEVILPFDSLSNQQGIPGEIKNALARAGLLYPRIQGKSADLVSCCKIAWNLAAAGGNLGILLYWAVTVCACQTAIDPFAPDRCRQELLSGISRGDLVVSFAVSEPGAGAHPKRLSTAAQPFQGGFRISGEKIFVTNGPEADIFIILARTGRCNDKNLFDAFILEKGEQGLDVSTMEIGALRPATHGRISMTDCFAPAGKLLQADGFAYDLIAKRFRFVEARLLFFALMGAIAHAVLGAAGMASGPGAGRAGPSSLNTSKKALAVNLFDLAGNTLGLLKGQDATTAALPLGYVKEALGRVKTTIDLFPAGTGNDLSALVNDAGILINLAARQGRA